MPVTFEEFDLLSVLSQSYPEIALPPVLGADHETMSSPLLVVTVGVLGAAGTVVTTIEVDGADGAEDPAALVAITVKVYPVLESKPPMVSGEDDPESPVAVVSTVSPELYATTV